MDVPAQPDPRESEANYRTLFELSSDAIILLDDHGFIDCNQATLQMFGYETKEEFCAKTPAMHSPPIQPDGRNSMEKANEEIKKAREKGKNSFEWVHRRGNGEDFPAEVLLTPVFYQGKSIILETVRDITKRKELEQQLRKEKEDQQIILDSIPAWVVYKDTENRFIRVNKAFSDVMGIPKEQLEGKSLFDIFPKEQAEAYWKDDKEVLTSGKPKQNIIESMKSPNGTLWVQTDKILYRDEKGNAIGIIVFTIDITSRKTAEDELKLQNIILTTQQETSLDGILIVDKNDKIISFNQNFIRIWGVSPEVIESKSDERAIQSVLDKLENPDEFVNSVKYLYSHRDKTYRDELRLKDGRILDRYSAPVMDDKKIYYGRVWYFRDITDMKTAEEKIKEKIAELEKMNILMVGREIKMVELKKENVLLKEKIAVVEKGIV